MEELRKKIAQRIKAGDKVKDIADWFQVTRKTVHKVKTVYVVSGDFSDCPKQGRPCTTRTEVNIAAVKAKIDMNPQNNIRKIARELKVNRNSVSTIVCKVLGLCSRACTKVQGLTAQQRAKQLHRCRRLLNMLKKKNNKVKVFSDEKNLYCQCSFQQQKHKIHCEESPRC